MLLKEIILVVVIIASLYLMAVTFLKLSELNLDKYNKMFYKTLTILIPIIGFFVVNKLYKENLKKNS